MCFILLLLHIGMDIIRLDLDQTRLDLILISLKLLLLPTVSLAEISRESEDNNGERWKMLIYMAMSLILVNISLSSIRIFLILKFNSLKPSRIFLGKNLIFFCIETLKLSKAVKDYYNNYEDEYSTESSISSRPYGSNELIDSIPATGGSASGANRQISEISLNQNSQKNQNSTTPAISNDFEKRKMSSITPSVQSVKATLEHSEQNSLSGGISIESSTTIFPPPPASVFEHEIIPPPLRVSSSDAETINNSQSDKDSHSISSVITPATTTRTTPAATTATNQETINLIKAADIENKRVFHESPA